MLAFGTTTGLGVSAILCLLIAVEGAYRLAWLWFREPWSAAAAALIYGLNGAVVLNTAWGYVLPMSYCSLPWLAYHAFRIGDRLADGLGLGFWMAFAVMNGIQYLSLYAGLLTARDLAARRAVQPAGRSRPAARAHGGGRRALPRPVRLAAGDRPPGHAGRPARAGDQLG